MKTSTLCTLLWLSTLIPIARAEAEYTGPAICASCHSDIARAQNATSMAKTWLGNIAKLPPGYAAPDIQLHAKLENRSTDPGFTVGGERHGISFLLRLSHLDGLPLWRTALIETRLMQSSHPGRLFVLSPGFPEEAPGSLGVALGRALTPAFEKKCLDCHGQPSAATGNGGVHCESCHGAGSEHARSKGSVQLKKIPVIDRCEPCHNGFAKLADPIPEDLLISNQVNALKQSECYRNSDGLTCTTCHDPHSDNRAVARKSNASCKNCHEGAHRDEAAKDGCVTCHMPEVKRGPFLLVDHWIRAGGGPKSASPRRPKRLYLRLIMTRNQAAANESVAALQRGESFFEVARRNSLDVSASAGGFLGDTQLDTMAAPLSDAAAMLAPGNISDVISTGGKFFVLQRMPTDFREQANRITAEASQLRAAHQLEAAVKKYQQALAIYPYFLRGLIFLAGALGEQGDLQRAAGVLQFALKLYPQDPAAQYNLGVTMGAMGRIEEEILSYRKAISVEPGLIGAYQNLGAALIAQNRTAEAAQVFRDGLQQDPLATALYYNLSVAEEQQGHAAESRAALALAKKLGPAQ